MSTPYDRVKLKSDHVAAQYGETRVSSDPAARAGEPHALAWSGRYRLNDYLYIGLCGAVAVSAMVLPGISGSLVLILMGAYFDVISAITGLSALGLDSLVFLGAFAMGMGLGGLLFARLVSYVFDRYYNATMGFLTGLMAGSLYALWPFKQAVVMPRQFLLQEGGIRILEECNGLYQCQFAAHLGRSRGLGPCFFPGRVCADGRFYPDGILIQKKDPAFFLGNLMLRLKKAGGRNR